MLLAVAKHCISKRRKIGEMKLIKEVTNEEAGTKRLEIVLHRE
jgi:hypothetical protein